MFLIFVESALLCLSCCVALGAGVSLRVGNAQSNLATPNVPISCSTLSVTNNGGFQVDWFQLLTFPIQSCQYDFGHSLLVGQTTPWLNLANNLPSPVSGGPLQQGTAGSCFTDDSVASVWVNVVAGEQFMLPYQITIDPSASFCWIKLTGTVDSVGYSVEDGSSFGAPVPTNRLCANKPGTFTVSFYELWQNANCYFQFNSGCINIFDVTTSTGCFQPGAPFYIWVNANGATQWFLAPQAFVFDPLSQWVQTTFDGTVDAITYSLTTQDSFPSAPVSEIAVCNQGVFSVSEYELTYAVNCADYSFSTKSEVVPLSTLASQNEGCFGPGSVFTLWVSPTAGTSTWPAPFNFVYTPSAYPLTVIAYGDVDSVGFGTVSPTVVNTSQNWICEPQEYSASDLTATNLDITSSSPYYVPQDGVVNNYPQCNNTAGLTSLTNIPVGVTGVAWSNPTACNDHMVTMLFVNLAIDLAEAGQ